MSYHVMLLLFDGCLQVLKSSPGRPVFLISGFGHPHSYLQHTQDPKQEGILISRHLLSLVPLITVPKQYKLSAASLTFISQTTNLPHSNVTRSFEVVYYQQVPNIQNYERHYLLTMMLTSSYYSLVLAAAAIVVLRQCAVAAPSSDMSVGKSELSRRK